MHIKALRLRNYACHADTSLSDLKGVTVLVGPNGGGKSALFEAIRTLSRILTGPVSQAFGPPPFTFDDKVFRGANPKVMAFDAELVDPQFPAHVNYLIELGYTGAENVGDPPTILSEIVKLGDDTIFDRAKRHVKVGATLSWSDIAADVSLLAKIRSLRRDFRGPQVLSSLAQSAGRVVNYRLEPRQISMASLEPESDTLVRMGYEGENLAACLYWLREKSPERFEKIMKDIQRVIPTFRGVLFNTVGVDRVGYSIEYADARQKVLAPNASSGTLLILGLATLLNVPTQPDITCIEEPETGLTPDAVRLFFDLLTKAAIEEGGRPRSQFLFSSHSPFVLVDAWNSLAENRSFIKRLHVADGHTIMDDIQSIIDRGDSGAVLQKDKSGRSIMGLKTAEELMCGRFLPSEDEPTVPHTRPRAAVRR